MSSRILVVDDEEAPLAVIQAILRKSGHEVTAVRDPIEGLALVRQSAFDLVVTDRNMPGMPGDALALAIKSHDPAIPVLMLTGTGHIMIEEGSSLPGVDLILGKPVSRQELLNAVEKLVDGHE